VRRRERGERSILRGVRGRARSRLLELWTAGRSRSEVLPVVWRLRPLAARCNLGLGRVARGAADLTRARVHLASAAEEFRSLGMRRALSHAEAEQARVP
jgi:hypothetical protein